MIKPPRPSINFYTPDDDLVKYDDYVKLEKYCDQLQLEKKALADLVGQYSKLSNDSIELDANNKKVEVVLLAD